MAQTIQENTVIHRYPYDYPDPLDSPFSRMIPFTPVIFLIVSSPHVTLEIHVIPVTLCESCGPT